MSVRRCFEVTWSIQSLDSYHPDPTSDDNSPLSRSAFVLNVGVKRTTCHVVFLICVMPACHLTRLCLWLEACIHRTFMEVDSCVKADNSPAKLSPYKSQNQNFPIQVNSKASRTANASERYTIQTQTLLWEQISFLWALEHQSNQLWYLRPWNSREESHSTAEWWKTFSSAKCLNPSSYTKISLREESVIRVWPRPQGRSSESQLFFEQDEIKLKHIQLNE